MVNKPIGICLNKKIFKHSGGWAEQWILYCSENAIPYEIVDSYQPDIVHKMGQYSALLWGIQNFVHADLIEARNILQVAQRMNIPVFPDHNTSWHFDDKIAEMYLLQSIKAPIPNSWVFYLLDDCIEWLTTKAEFPLVAKLRCGSGASNVTLLKTKSAAVKYASRMFSAGFHPAPSLMYKAYSKAQSSKNWRTAFARIKKIPEFLHTLSRAKRMAKERDYCYFQEFIDNPGFDLKVVVVGDKLSFIARKTRRHDFRASGGGDCYYDKSLITEQIRDSAFAAADIAEMQCMGFDYVVDKETGKGFIIEMCFGFDWAAVAEAGGYWDRAGNWHDEALHVPREVIQNILKGI